MNEKKFGDPAIFGLGAFGVSLMALGAVLSGLWPEAHGVLFACVLYGALGETIAGMWHIARNETYLGSVMALFGLWLFGFYFFQTQGMAMKVFSHAGVGLYCFALLPPLVIMWMPAIKNNKGFTLNAAFAALVLLVLFLGLGNAMPAIAKICDKIAGWLSLVSAILIWTIMYHHTSALFEKEA